MCGCWGGAGADLEGAGGGVAKSGKKVRGDSSEPNPMARLKD